MIRDTTRCTLRSRIGSRLTSALRLTAVLLAGLAALAVATAPVLAEQIELANGSIMHGRAIPAQSTEDELAVELFETGGIVMVRWDHVEETRRRQSRVDMGLEGSGADEEILVAGHVLIMSNGEQVQGLCTNVEAKGEKVRLKQASGEREYPREQVQGIKPIEVPGLFVYTPDELYKILVDKAQPQKGAQHKDMAVRCMSIGALRQARDHLNLAKDDKSWAESPEGRSLEKLYRELELTERSLGARTIATKIQLAVRANRWNEARDLLKQLGDTYTDEAV
ncbi:MAG: hypothetical protein ACKVXR_09650, partial [Planctomycetota bacterium]